MKATIKKQSALFFSFTWDFLCEYLPKQAGHSSETIESYRDSLTLFRRFLADDLHKSIGTFRFPDCTKDCIFGFRDYLKRRGNKFSTINVRVTAIRAYLHYAADRDVSVQSVALSISQIKPLKGAQAEEKALDEDALATMLEAPPLTEMGMRDRAILIILYDSAMRLGELLSIRLSDLSLEGEHPCILLHGKGNKERRTPLTDKSARHLQQYLQTFHAEPSRDDYLFSTTIKGKTDKMSRSNVQRIVKQYAGIARSTCSDMPDSVHPHMLRRTRATNLYQDGVELELVSAILGHERLDTTKIYAKPSISQMHESMESVPTPVADERPLWIGDEDEMARLCGLR